MNSTQSIMNGSIIPNETITTESNKSIKMNSVKTEEVEAYTCHEIKQDLAQNKPVNIEQKIVTRKLSKRVVRVSKAIDIITVFTSIITSAVCSGLSSSKDIPVYQRQLTVICAIIGGICSCVTGVKSMVLDSLKNCAKNYNNNQYYRTLKSAQQIEDVEAENHKLKSKPSSRKLPAGVVLASKLIDVISAIAAVTTGAVCSVLGEKDDNSVYQKYLMYICAIVSGVCGCVGTAKSQLLDVLKGCINDKAAQQTVVK